MYKHSYLAFFLRAHQPSAGPWLAFGFELGFVLRLEMVSVAAAVCLDNSQPAIHQYWAQEKNGSKTKRKENRYRRTDI